MEELTDYKVVVSHGVRWLLHRDCAEWLLARIVPDPWSLPGVEGCEVVRQTGTRSVIRFPVGECGINYAYLKRNKNRKLYPFLKYSILNGPPTAEWYAALEFAQLGIAVPRPLAVGEKRRLGIVLEDFAVFEEIEDAMSLRDAMERHPGKRKRLLLTAARPIAKMHANGIYHPDIHLGNILMTDVESEHPGVFIIDLHHVKRRRSRSSRQAHRLYDLAMLWCSASLYIGVDVWRDFLHAYASEDEAFRSDIAEYARCIDEMMFGLRETHHKSRTKRCLIPSGGFAVHKEPGRTIYRMRTYPLDQVEEALAAHRAAVREGGDVVKVDERATVTLLRDMGLCVKEFPYRDLWDGFRNTVGCSRGLRAWVQGNSMVARGIPTCDFLALVEERKFGLKKRSFLIMSDLGEVQAVDACIYSQMLSKPAQTKRAFARSLAGLFAEMHRKGVFHGDTKASNILVRDSGEQDWTFYPVDVGDVRFLRTLAVKQRARNLAQLNSSLRRSVTNTDRLRFFKEYVRRSEYYGDERLLLRAVVDDTLERYCVWKRPGIEGRKLRVLHLFGDWKWTGPAEPVLMLCEELQRMGHEIWLACKRGPIDHPQQLASKAEEAGIRVVTDFAMDRGVLQRHLLGDILRLRRFLEEHAVDVLHVHQGYEQFIGGVAARRCSRRIAIVRTNHAGEPLASELINRMLLRHLTDGLVEISERALREDVDAAGLPAECVVRIDGATDLERFCRKRGNGKQKRRELGIREHDIVLGIAARMQKHRRFDVLLKAVSIAARELPTLKLLILGRGTHAREVVLEPARRLGIEDRVILGGYRSGDYVSVLSTFDIKVFLVPGSDGSCRAVREAMAMEKPVIAARRGALPEIVVQGETGLLVNDSADELADAIVRLAKDRELRERMGRAARARAEERFSVSRQAEIVEELCVKALSARRR